MQNELIIEIEGKIVSRLMSETLDFETLWHLKTDGFGLVRIDKLGVSSVSAIFTRNWAERMVAEWQNLLSSGLNAEESELSHARDLINQHMENRAHTHEEGIGDMAIGAAIWLAVNSTKGQSNPVDIDRIFDGTLMIEYRIFPEELGCEFVLTRIKRGRIQAT